MTTLAKSCAMIGRLETSWRNGLWETYCKNGLMLNNHILDVLFGGVGRFPLVMTVLVLVRMGVNLRDGIILHLYHQKKEGLII